MKGCNLIRVFCLTTSVLLLSSCSAKKCENTESFREASPSGKLKATFYSRQCGNPLNEFSTFNASILPTSSTLNNEPGNALIINNGYVVKAAWTSDTELVVDYFGETRKTDPNVNGVNIIFRDGTSK